MSPDHMPRAAFDSQSSKKSSSLSCVLLTQFTTQREWKLHDFIKLLPKCDISNLSCERPEPSNQLIDSRF